MDEYLIKIEKIKIEYTTFHFEVSGEFPFTDNLAKAKIIMHFDNGIEDRRIPLMIPRMSYNEAEGIMTFKSRYNYFLQHLFWKSKNSTNEVRMHFNLLWGDVYEENIQIDMTPEIFEQDGLCYTCRVEGNTLVFTKTKDSDAKLKKHNAQIKRRNDTKKAIKSIYYWISFVLALCLLPWFIIDGLLALAGYVELDKRAQKTKANKFRKLVGHVNARLYYLSKHRISTKNIKKFMKKQNRKSRVRYFKRTFKKYAKKYAVEKNRVAFISVRRNDLSGNFEFVYNQMKDRADLDVKIYLNSADIFGMTKEDMDTFAYLCATSKVIVLDEFTPYIHYFDLRPETKVVQLWHACGAFKTFGFTRLGRPKGSQQKTRNHRNYDYVAVSGENVRIWYAEGFGVPTKNIVATGVPRTDVFFDEEYKAKTRAKIYEEYPQLQGKKVVLFAPTFRGSLRENANYPMGRFKVDKFMDAVGEDYFLIIKHHPFIRKKHPIPEGYRDRVLDLSDHTELNDLLFVTDIIITDYSSLVFEASLLKIPMLFYTYDLKQYIKDRDFYFDFSTFVPGPFFYKQEELQEAVVEDDFDIKRIEDFSRKYFDSFDGRSTERVVDMICHAQAE